MILISTLLSAGYGWAGVELELFANFHGVSFKHVLYATNYSVTLSQLDDIVSKGYPLMPQ